MFDCDLDAFQKMVTTVSSVTRARSGAGNGSTRSRRAAPKDYVTDYVKLCKAGVEAAHQVDPKFAFGPGRRACGHVATGSTCSMPAPASTSMRLPIHYANGAGIAEAREDLDSFGLPKVEVWENESCAFVIQWDCPGLEIVSETRSCKWIMRQWTDELAAGCEKLIYFGGEGRRDRQRRLPAGRFHAAAQRRHAGRVGRQDV